MAKGTVKWYDETKGYGFILQDGGGPDAFVHYTAVKAMALEGRETLLPNERLEYDWLPEANGRRAAQNLKLVHKG